MRSCLVCNEHFAGLENKCPKCGAQPTVIDGFEAFASELARSNSGFKSEYFADLSRLEAGNFWFCARNSLIIWALQKYAANLRSFMEVGCGTGFVLTGIADAFPKARLTGSEIFTVGLGFAKKRLPVANLIQMDARKIPFVEEFDAVGAFDILEHIEEDGVVLSQLWQALKPGGVLLLTVPQHQWLWSQSDEHACHVRRYHATELKNKVHQAGFKILRVTSFVSLLLPVMLLSRIKRRTKNKYDPLDEFHIPRWMDSLFYWVMALENLMIQIGINFPVGGSLMVVAQKPE